MTTLTQAVRDAIEALKTPTPRELIAEQLERALIHARAKAAGMPWARAETVAIDDSSYYVVQHNGHEWRDFDLMVMRGVMVRHRLEPDYVRGRPEWIAKIDRPSSL